jgi:hypothetical protein
MVHRVAGVHGGKHQTNGVDIRTGNKAIEIKVTSNDLNNAVSQLKSSRKPCKYVATPLPLREKALRLTRGTGIGVMDGNGKIVKRCRSR